MTYLDDIVNVSTSELSDKLYLFKVLKDLEFLEGKSVTAKILEFFFCKFKTATITKILTKSNDGIAHLYKVITFGCLDTFPSLICTSANKPTLIHKYCILIRVFLP